MTLHRQLPVILPNRYTCKLRYTESFALAPSGSTVVAQVFRANDLYDPNGLPGGHQPMGFDQLCLMFNHFTVTGSKITVISTQAATGTLVGSFWGCMLTDSGTRAALMSGISEIMEQEGGQRRPRQTYGSYNQNALISPYNNKVKKFFSAKKFFNVKDIVGGNEYACTASQSPAEEAYYEVWATSVLGSTPSEVHFLATIDYIVVCQEPKTLAQS